MDMEATEEPVGSTTSNTDASATHIAKGKRTKRHRPSSSNSPSSSASADDYVSFNSSSTTASQSTEEEEEEDMANCLILLAQGGGGDAPNKQATTTKVNGFYLYECKTCNRTFPSFQALGGHRASHKKPKVEEKKPQPPPPAATQVTSSEFEEAGDAQFKSISQNSIQLASNIKAFQSNKAKTHECSICGSEFTSGQALGGHMRRHRASTNAAAVEVKPRNVLELDLNLPAPEDDLRDSKFQFAPTQKSLVMSAPALVDCHY